MAINPSTKRLLKTRKLTTLSLSPGSICPEANKTYRIEGEKGNILMHRIRLGLGKTRMEQQIAGNILQNFTGGVSRVRILCMIYTVHLEHDQHANQAAIAETWRRECDGFFGASNFTNHFIGTIDLPHQGPEIYGNMLQKIRSMWTYAFENYRYEYDFFYIAGDGTYVLVDHLRSFLESEHVKKLERGYIDRISRIYAIETNATAQLRPRPLLLATPMGYRGYLVVAGGGGNVLNQAALDPWGKYGADSFRPESQDPREDIWMSEFFLEQGVYLSDTQDEHGGWRFGGSAESTIHFSGRNSPIMPMFLKRKYGFANNLGIDHVSQHQISFHLKRCKDRLAATTNSSIRDLMFRYHAFFNRLCPNEQR